MRSLAAVLLFTAIHAGAQESASKIFSDYYEDLLRWQPGLATSVGRTDLNDRWPDYSKPAREQRIAMLKRYEARLSALDQPHLSDGDKLSARLMRFQLERAIETEPIQPMLNVGQMFGFHNRVLATVEQMPAATVRDYDNIIARLNAVPAYIDQNIGWVQEAMAAGLVQPANVVDLLLKQLATQGAMNEDRTPLLAAFRKMPASITQPDRDRLIREGRVAYATKVVPSWQKLHAWMRDTYLPAARKQVGVSAVPEGAAWYTRLVRQQTTTNMTPAEIHELGRKELARIEGEMAAIVKSAGFSGTLEAYETKLRIDPAELFRDREEMLVYCRNVLGLAAPELPKLFKHIPRMPIGVRAIPPDRESVTASHYLAPALDGSRAGFFMLNAYQPEKQVKYTIPALVLHEAVPGHHFQIALQGELEGLPQFRRVVGYTAFSEGWALYAESLGDALGIYDTPVKRLGQLDSERFRAVRLIVDTGLHSMNWTREQAVDFFKVHAPTESLAEVDRYISWPGQALGYKIGQLKIRQLRDRAEQALGPKFDIRDFHDVVLRNGALPLEVLEEQVNAWIGKQ